MILGIDYGLKKIGLATSEGAYARGIGSISNTPSRITQLKEKITETIETIVIGLPNSAMDQKIKEFGEELQKEFNCQVIFEDEFNSTQEAIQTMIISGVKQKARRKDDAIAATTILQRYLDRQGK
jgi:putative transcription antitermination factor YqgF